MPSFWPWKGDQNSAASFERTLSGLAEKITKASTTNESLRQRSRKLKVSWTIYGGFTYILTTLIFILVTGWQNWKALEYTTVAGGPVVLWGVRRLLTLWYDYRIANTQAYLSTLNKERDTTIDKLKAATKYDSTQQLIDKYSSKPSTPGSTGKDAKGKDAKGGQAGMPKPRVFSNPPPTANIPRNNIPVHQGLPGPLEVPGQRTQTEATAGAPSFHPPTQQASSPTAEFAPNAFTDTPPTAVAASVFGEATWYDRILDALIGDDETSAKNRFALICANCKLVNGQAPPGARTFEDVGKWRCSACGAMNGVDNETAKLVKEITQGKPAAEVEEAEASDEDDGELVGTPSDSAAETSTPASNTRRASKKKEKK